MITNKKVKELVMMNQKSKVRKEANVFLVEGIKMFLEAPTDRIREIYISESFFATKEVLEKLEKFPYEIVSDALFKKISDTMTPQGILCVVERKEEKLENMIQKKMPFLMLLEDIQDPGNLGTIVRTGEGAGVSGFILSKGCVDIYNPKTIRSTMGSIFRMPIIYSDEFEETIHKVKQKDIKVYAAHLKGKQNYDEINYFEDKCGIAFMIGNEGNGLKDATADLADCYIKIPMEGKVESLNAAIASGILMYEAAKRRRRIGGEK